MAHVRLGCHQSYCTSWDLSVLKFFSKLYISIRTDMWQDPVDAAAKDTVTNHGKYSMPEEARSSTVWMNTLPGIIRGRSHPMRRRDLSCRLLRSSQSETGLEACC